MSLLEPGTVEPPAERAPAWGSLLERACRGDGLRSVYQPIVDVMRGVSAGYEALIRFDAGPSNPELWFAAARTHGCEADLDAAALRSALAGRDSLPPNCFLTVNVSPLSLMSDVVRAVWRDQGDLSGLVVELTEQTQIDSYAALEPDLNRLRSAGALIAVDDAGSGYAGLQHLITLRPEIIKLDRMLVTDLDIDESKRALTEMMGTLAGRLDAWLLAEGIERAGELEVLASLGVPLVQGYYLARPAVGWAELNPEAVMHLVSRSPNAAVPTVRALLQQAPVARHADQVAALFAEPHTGIVVIVDSFERPRGIVTAEAASFGVVDPGMRLNLDTSLTDAVMRALTRPRAARFTPLICTDAAGRYVGVVHMERLVEALTRL